MPEIVERNTDFKSYVKNEIANTPVGRLKDIAFENPIIIGGCGSSGTTLLKTMFDSHKNIACGQEISFFDHPEFYKTSIDDLYRMFKEQDFIELFKNFVIPIATEYGGTFGLFAPNFGESYHRFSATDIIFQMADNLKHFVDIYFTNYAYAHGKKRWAEKTPNNIFCIKEVLEFLPDAKFIHVIRDGRDVALSLTKSRGYDLHKAVIRWLLSVKAGIEHRGNPRYYEIKYEDLILDTENSLKKLMDFLDEEFDPNMLNFEEAGKKNPMNYGSTPIHTKSIGKWKNPDIDPTELRILNISMGDLLEKLGYEV